MEIARSVSGLCRGRWEWGGKLYTSAGVEVPPEVMAEDEALLEEGKELAPDDQVLDMTKVTLPKEALPPGFSLCEQGTRTRTPKPEKEAAKKAPPAAKT